MTPLTFGLMLALALILVLVSFWLESVAFGAAAAAILFIVAGSALFEGLSFLSQIFTNGIVVVCVLLGVFMIFAVVVSSE